MFRDLVESAPALRALSAAMLPGLFGFILVIAFAKLLGRDRRRHDGRHPGRPVRLVSAFVLTGIYVHRANSEFDDLTHRSWKR
jgi:uncharacterized membrane protein (DUF485 family)